MSWQSKVLGLVKKYGSPAKFAASTILNAVIPGSPFVIALVEEAFDSVQKTAQDDWESNLSKQMKTSADNQTRLEQVLEILGGDLKHLFAKVASYETRPEIARKLVEASRQNDARLQAAVEILGGVAHRFDHLEQLTSQVLAGQQKTHGKIEELSSAFLKFVSSPAAVVPTPLTSGLDSETGFGENSREIIRFHGHKASVIRVAFSTPPNRIVSYDSRDALIIWETKTGNQINIFEKFGSPLWSVRSIALSPFGLNAVVSGTEEVGEDDSHAHRCRVGSDEAIHYHKDVLWLFDLATGSRQRCLSEGWEIYLIAFSPNGQYVVYSGDGPGVWASCVDVATAKNVGGFERECETLSDDDFFINALAVAPDGKHALASYMMMHDEPGEDFEPDPISTWDLDLWDMTTRKIARRFRGHTGAILDIVFSANGQYAASCSADRTVRYWDVKSGRTIHRFVGHSDEVTCIAISPDGQRVVSGSKDETVRLWSVNVGRELCCLQGHKGSVLAVAISPCGKSALSGGDDKTIRLWSLPW